VSKSPQSHQESRPSEKVGPASSIFLAGDGLLVGYLETEDYQAALDAMAATDVNSCWQAQMSEFFVADGPPDQSFLRITEIFHQELVPPARRACPAAGIP
jgi:hypothetical protein